MQNTSEFDINQFTLLAAWCSCDLVMVGSSISNMEMMLSQCNYPQNTHKHTLLVFFSDCQLVPVNAFSKSFWDLFSFVIFTAFVMPYKQNKRQNVFLIEDQAIVEDHLVCSVCTTELLSRRNSTWSWQDEMEIVAPRRMKGRNHKSENG